MKSDYARRQSAKPNRRLTLFEIVEKTFSGIIRFKSKGKLLNEELEKFVSVSSSFCYQTNQLASTIFSR